MLKIWVSQNCLVGLLLPKLSDQVGQMDMLLLIVQPPLFLNCELHSRIPRTQFRYLLLAYSSILLKHSAQVQTDLLH